MKFISGTTYILQDYNYSKIREPDWCWYTKYTKNVSITNIPSTVNAKIYFTVSGFIDDTVRIYKNNSLVGDIWTGTNKDDGRQPGTLNSTTNYSITSSDLFSVRLINSGANYMTSGLHVYYHYEWLTK